MEVSISYCICTEISEDGDIRTNQTGYRDNIAEAVPAERGRDYRGTGVPGSYPYVSEYPAQI